MGLQFQLHVATYVIRKQYTQAARKRPVHLRQHGPDHTFIHEWGLLHECWIILATTLFQHVFGRQMDSADVFTPITL